MKIFTKRKIIELEWSEHGGHKVIVMTEHFNGEARRDMEGAWDKGTWRGHGIKNS